MKQTILNVEVMKFPNHLSSSVEISASPELIFAYLDGQKNLSSHMEQSSWMMAGSSMKIELDQQEGKTVGAEIILRGSMLGIPLLVREAITERHPPSRKVWETAGEQKMVILDQYRMGFETTPSGATSKLMVFIDYSLPKPPGRKVLGLLLGKLYARWCIERVTRDAAYHFRMNP